MASHLPAKFSCDRHCGSGDIIVLVCHVILQNHIIKGSNALYGWEPLTVTHHLAKLGGMDIEVVDIKWFQFVT